MEIYVKVIVFPYFLFFHIFIHDFIRCLDFTRIAASNTATDDVTNYVTHTGWPKKVSHYQKSSLSRIKTRHYD